MATGLEFILPSEVIEAIEYQKQKDPTDKHGDGAFQFDYKNIRENKQGGVRYANFNVLKKSKTGEWKYVPLNLKFMNLATKAKIYPPGHEKKKYPGANLHFNGSSSFINNGKEEKYGQVKIMIYAAFARITKKLLTTKAINNGSNTKICSTIQTEVITDKKTKATAKIDDPVIRVDIPFDSQQNGNVKVIKEDAIPKCEIYNASKKLKEAQPGKWPYELAAIEGKPLNYKTIGEFITAGSTCSGLDNMTGVSFSNMGISLASKTTLIVVKQSAGFKPQPANIFNASDIEAMAGAATETIEDPDVAKTPSAPTATLTAGEAGDFTTEIDETYDPDAVDEFQEDE